MTRRQLFLEVLLNWILPYVIYDQAKARLGAGEAEALIWATILPGLVVVVGLLRQRKWDVIATTTLVTLGISIAIAALTEDARLLQLRESYLSAVIGALMIVSCLVGRPALVWLAPRMLPPDRQAAAKHPIMVKLFTRLTWIWGVVSAGELALKWWMVDHLTIGQVLAFGPVAFAALTGLGLLLSVLTARGLRSQVLAAPPGVFGPPGILPGELPKGTAETHGK